MLSSLCLSQLCVPSARVAAVEGTIEAGGSMFIAVIGRWGRLKIPPPEEGDVDVYIWMKCNDSDSVGKSRNGCHVCLTRSVLSSWSVRRCKQMGYRYHTDIAAGGVVGYVCPL